MTEDIKIVDLPASDNTSLTALYKEGWVIERTIQYTQRFFNSYQYYYGNGNSTTRYEASGECPTIKYILRRDAISRNVYG